MKNKTQADRHFDNAVSTIVKHFSSPSLLVYFLSKTAELAYESDMRLDDKSSRKNTHTITLQFMRDIGEPWINKDLWDIALNLKNIYATLGYEGFYSWVTDVVAIHAKAESDSVEQGAMYDLFQFFAGLYEVAILFKKIKSAGALE